MSAVAGAHRELKGIANRLRGDVLGESLELLLAERALLPMKMKSR